MDGSEASACLLVELRRSRWKLCGIFGDEAISRHGCPAFWITFLIHLGAGKELLAQQIVEPPVAASV
jgi:hypothetical protein